MPVARRRISLRRKKRDTTDLFEEEFALESLKSDRLRVTILIGAIVSALLLVLILVPIFFNGFSDGLSRQLPPLSAGGFYHRWREPLLFVLRAHGH